MSSARSGSFGRYLFAALLCCVGLASCGTREQPPDQNSEDDEALGARPLEPLPITVDFDRPRAELGELLFRDPSLSGDGKVACSDCHHESHGLADDQPHTAVAGRPETALNPPTMYNVRFLYKLSWSGKYDSLESHLDALMTNPKVMASSWQRATERLSELASYAAKFKAVFADGLTPPNVRQALLEYERSLVTPNSPFDRYLRGDAQAISSDAKQGFALFKSYGCASCHQGMAIGGNVFERFGVLRDYFADRGHFETADLGRFNVTSDERDRFVFRVPSLRNVALTAPYFHNGSAATLDAAVGAMAHYQLGRELDAKDTSSLVAFLRSLTGEYWGKPL
jgi:cytochrome c peroxidase